MRNTRHSQKSLDWEQVGFEAMAETRDVDRAKQVCGYKLQAFADEHGPATTRYKSLINDLQGRTRALAAQLYQRHHPVSDTRMLALSGLCLFLLVAFIVAFGASVAGNTMTLVKFGWDFASCIVVGFLGTGLVTVVGQQAHLKLLTKHPLLETAIVALLSLLTVWALIDFGQGRGEISQIGIRKATQSFVEDTSTSSNADTNAPQTQPIDSEANIRDHFKDALTKLTIVADVAVGLLLGALLTLYNDEDYAGWRTLRSDKRKIAKYAHELNQHLAVVEISTKRCAAGIVRAVHFKNPNHPPYLVSALLLALCGGVPGSAHAQADSKRAEAILIDATGSVASKGSTRGLFGEYLVGTKQLLVTEPPSSRVWVQIITTDSFGSAPTLLKGWTPSAQGVFTETLDLARRQLVKTFESKSSGLAPVAAATDITGGLWRAKAALESTGNAVRLSRDVFIFSDMVNEVRGFVMPALLPTGAEQMLETAKAKGLVVPLSGYRVHIYGASTTGQSPQMWNTIRAFWTMYFRAAGAELVTYSSEVSVERN